MWNVPTNVTISQKYEAASRNTGITSIVHNTGITSILPESSSICNTGTYTGKY
jgi:hypothetical protein